MRSGIAATLALSTAASCTRARHDYADIVFRGGPVYTVDSAQPHASAVAVAGTRCSRTHKDQPKVSHELGLTAAISS